MSIKLAYIILAILLKRWYEWEREKLMPKQIVRNVEWGVMRVNIRGAVDRTI